MVLLPHWPIPPKIQNIKYDLTRITKLLAALGSPHLKLPPVIHIAGTNGKGSTVAYLRSIFSQAGYTAHSYISPHLLNFNERITLAGKPISDEYLHEICEKTRLIVVQNNLEPTFFEAITAAAFLAFAEVPADVLILETGMGGRLDATNVVEQPILTIITPISFDHMQYLGNTLPAIAREKAGIIKHGVPCIASAQPDKVLQVLEAKANLKQAPLFALGRDFILSKQIDTFLLKTADWEAELPLPNLPGEHQIINAATVAASCYRVLSQYYNFSPQALVQGLTTAYWPGRLQRISAQQLQKITSAPLELWVDGAHNSSGAEALAKWVRSHSLRSPINLIVGLTHNRQISDFTEYFRSFAKHIYCVPIISEKASYPPHILAELIQEEGLPATACDSITAALNIITTKFETPSTVLVTGSLFLAADFLRLVQ